MATDSICIFELVFNWYKAYAWWDNCLFRMTINEKAFECKLFGYQGVQVSSDRS